MMKIKVLQLINSMEPGGAESLVKSFLKNVDTNKFEWHLAYFYKKGSFLKEYKANIKIVNFSKDGKFTLSSLTQLFSYIKNNKFHVIHTHLIQAGIIGKLFGKLLRIPVIVSTRHYEWLPKSFYLSWLEDYLSKKINTRTISISKEVSTYMRKIGFSESKIQLIQNGVDVNFFKPENYIKKEKNSIVAVGRLTEQKNFGILIEAIKLLITNNNNINCYIVGEGHLLNYLLEKISFNNLTSNVFLMNSMPNEQVKNFIQQKEVFVSTSIFEGLPISLLEAMAMEMPIIASDVGGVKDILDNEVSGVLIEPNNVELLARSIEEVLGDEERKKKLGQTARNIVLEKFSIQNTVEETQKLYENLLNQKNYVSNATR